MQHSVDLCPALHEGAPVPVELSVMVQVMHHDFESARGKRPAQCLGGLITQRHETERGTDTLPLLESRQLFAAGDTPRRFDIVGQDKCEPLALGPAGKRRRCETRRFPDWPELVVTPTALIDPVAP